MGIIKVRTIIKLDSYLRSLDNENVYVVGDNMLYTVKGEERPVPQMVENCEHSVVTAAKNIVCSITGEGQMSEYNPSFHGMMVCIGEGYGMIKASSIGKEWFEQSEAFSNYVLGKTVEEVKGILVNEEGAPADQELSSSVTVGIGEFQNIIEKAYNTAK